MDSETILNKVAQQLSPPLFKHICQVARTAEKLAVLFNEDPQKAYLSGILHDFAKERPAAELLMIAEENGLLAEELYRQVPFLLHGPVGSILIKKEMGIDDQQISDAVCYHTLGRPFMRKLEKIIFLADMIEPDRDFPGVEALRELCHFDLDRAMSAALDMTLEHCLRQKRLIHPQTIAARNYFLQLQEQGEQEGASRI